MKTIIRLLVAIGLIFGSLAKVSPVEAEIVNYVGMKPTSPIGVSAIPQPNPTAENGETCTGSPLLTESSPRPTICVGWDFNTAEHPSTELEIEMQVTADTITSWGGVPLTLWSTNAWISVVFEDGFTLQGIDSLLLTQGVYRIHVEPADPEWNAGHIGIGGGTSPNSHEVNMGSVDELTFGVTETGTFRVTFYGIQVMEETQLTAGVSVTIPVYMTEHWQDLRVEQQLSDVWQAQTWYVHTYDLAVPPGAEISNELPAFADETEGIPPTAKDGTFCEFAPLLGITTPRPEVCTSWTITQTTRITMRVTSELIGSWGQDMSIWTSGVSMKVRTAGGDTYENISELGLSNPAVYDIVVTPIQPSGSMAIGGGRSPIQSSPEKAVETLGITVTVQTYPVTVRFTLGSGETEEIIIDSEVFTQTTSVSLPVTGTQVVEQMWTPYVLMSWDNMNPPKEVKGFIYNSQPHEVPKEYRELYLPLMYK